MCILYISFKSIPYLNIAFTIIQNFRWMTYLILTISNMTSTALGLSTNICSVIKASMVVLYELKNRNDVMTNNEYTLKTAIFILSTVFWQNQNLRPFFCSCYFVNITALNWCSGFVNFSTILFSHFLFCLTAMICENI